MSQAALADSNGVALSGAPSSTDAARRPASVRRDAFPYTRRPLPWVLAAFMAMVFFIPVDGTELKVNIGVDAHPDRFAVILLVLAWVWFGGDQRAFVRTKRSKLFVMAACVFLVVAVASLMFDAPRIINMGELQLSEKKFALLVSFLVLGWFALSALRFEDLRGFISYLIGLAVLMAIGMLVERHTGYNVFYEWTRTIFKPIATVIPSPTDIHPGLNDEEGRAIVVGPTRHGLAATAMLVMIMPFALVRMLDAASRRSRWLNAFAFMLLIGGAVATDRKTALLVPFAVVVYVAWYRPRLLRLAPIGLVLVVGAIHFAAPGSLGTLLEVNHDVNNTSTLHREHDFTDLRPDVLAHLAFGRGYGAVNTEEPYVFRINDDEYLDELWTVGFVGLFAFIWLILAPVVLARKAIRLRGPTVSSLALAASAGCVAFFVACALFDSWSYSEPSYIFFLLGGLTTIAAAGPEGNVEPSRELARRLVARRPPRAVAAGA
jgi:hypothetical protein